jgi:alpha-L-rhamnosidase
MYQGYLNGEAISNQLFTPGFTYYVKRLQYQTFNITSLLKQGPNVLGFILGDGWYRGSIGISSKRYYYGKNTNLAVLLELEFTDGTQTALKSDNSWKTTQNGPIRKSDLKEGEIFDARMELTGWLSSIYNDSQWNSAIRSTYAGDLVPSEGEAVLEHERFTPEVIVTPDGSTVLDFKQNLFGYVEFTVTGKRGQHVKLIHGETLDEKGNFTLKNLILEGFSFKAHKIFQEVHYILKDGRQTYKPHFTGHGFRYVKLENWPEPILPQNFTSIAIYSNCESAGTFECSNSLVNQLVKNATWGQKSNFVDIPTDCPQRERAGWTGDISCYSPTAAYLMNINKFLTKWLKDLPLQQKRDGNIGCIIPDVGLIPLINGSAGWADAAITVPYLLYQVYGNTKILEEQYPSMLNWMNFLAKRAQKTHISRRFKRNPYKAYTIDSGFHFGEWLEPGSVMAKDGIKGFLAPDFEIATGCYAYSAKLIREIAKVLGKTADAQKFGELFENIRKAYRYNYTRDGRVVSKRQCKFVRPVAYDLLSEEEKQTNMATLNQMIIQNQYKIGTGFLTTPWVLKMLSDYGYNETAYKMLENTDRPGWLYEVKKGATTIWENWNGINESGVPIDSFNHYLMGSVVGWLYSHVAGIRPLGPGYSKVLIKPQPGGSLNTVNCSYKSQSGIIKSTWKIEDKKFSLEIETPTYTEVVLPDGTIHKVEKGNHTFFCSQKE